MKKFALIITFFAIVRDLANSAGLTSRIVNGNTADISDFKYQLSLRRNNQHICGASVISVRWAISAAHCIDDIYKNFPHLFSLRAGSNSHRVGGKITKVRQFRKHPLYEDKLKKCDVMLLQTTEPFDLNIVDIITLPNANEEIVSGSSAIVSGWGYTDPVEKQLSPVLRSVNIFIIDQKLCNESLSHTGGVFDSMFCAGFEGRDSCQGDSGGPIKINEKLMGVVSWGVECGDKDYPGVYARLSFPSIRSWIKLIAKV